MRIQRALEIKHKHMLRPKTVEVYYGIRAASIYRWKKEEELTGKKAPLNISKPKNSTMFFVEHQSVIEYFNKGLHLEGLE